MLPCRPMSNPAKDEMLDLLGFGDYAEHDDKQPVSGETASDEAKRPEEVPTVPPPPVVAYPPPESVPPPPLVPAPPTPSSPSLPIAAEPPPPSASGIRTKAEPQRRLSSGSMRAVEARNVARVDEVVANLRKDWRSE